MKIFSDMRAKSVLFVESSACKLWAIFSASYAFFTSCPCCGRPAISCLNGLGIATIVGAIGAWFASRKKKLTEKSTTDPQKINACTCGCGKTSCETTENRFQ